MREVGYEPNRYIFNAIKFITFLLSKIALFKNYSTKCEKTDSFLLMRSIIINTAGCIVKILY